jgi:hypothetical protein
MGIRVVYCGPHVIDGWRAGWHTPAGGIARSEIASGLGKPFDAPSVGAALEMVLEDLKKFLEHVTGERAK